MWTETAREQYRREDLRYASDMTDAEWALIKTTESGGPRGYDAAKKIKGRKRRVSRAHHQGRRCEAV
jgi:hypothetical protein